MSARPLDFSYAEAQKRIKRKVALTEIRLLDDFISNLEELTNDYSRLKRANVEKLGRLDQSVSIVDWQRIFGDVD